MFRLDWIDWEPRQQKESVTCVYAPHMLGVMHWLQNNPTEHVALILVREGSCSVFQPLENAVRPRFSREIDSGTLSQCKETPSTNYFLTNSEAKPG